MMTLLAIDSDGHITEDRVDWAARVPAEFRDRVPHYVRNDSGQARMTYDGYTFPNEAWDGVGREATRKITRRTTPGGMTDPHIRIPDMDAEGIQSAVLYGSGFMFHGNSTSDWRLAAAVCTAWNDWASKEYCAPYPDRLFFSALIPFADIGAAVEEAHRAVRDLGAVSVTLHPNFNGTNLDNHHYDRLYAALEELDVPACVHATLGTRRLLPITGAHENWLIAHAMAMPLGMSMALASMVLGGVMARFPRLRCAFLEAGCGWLPFVMDRLDEHHEKLPALVPWLDRRPSDYIKSDRFYITCEPEENISYVLDALGDDHLMYLSDYAHWDCEFPNSVRAIADRPSLTDVQKQKIMRENAIRLYKLPVAVNARNST